MQTGSKAVAADAAENRFLSHVRYIYEILAPGKKLAAKRFAY